MKQLPFYPIFILKKALLTCAVISILSGGVCADFQSPEEFLGHRVGADYKYAGWDKVVPYFLQLGEGSDRVNVRELGKTTLGKPMLLVEISSASTIADLAPHKENQRKLADPRLIESEEEEQRLIQQSKVVVLVSCQLHSTEAAASQMSMELAYDLAMGDSDEIREILDRVIILLIPCANPDGQQMVSDYYHRTLGTPWEGGRMPWIYQKYAGHDNNRDWFMLNLQETRLSTQVLYKEWFPTFIWDVHQARKNSMRMFVPPFYDPRNPNTHPLIDKMLYMVGGNMAADLSRHGKTGVVHNSTYDTWWAGGFRTTPIRHNMIGLLTEAASANIASPINIPKNQLRGGRRGMPSYDMAANFPDPWPGGWWRLRDIVEYEKIAAMSIFKMAARFHDLHQSNYVIMGRDAISKGNSEPPFAWVVTADQRDPGSAYEMLERLHSTGIEVHQALDPFTAGGVDYPKDSFILYSAQPYRPHLKDMMERQVYPDRSVYPGGPAEAPYDIAGWTFPLLMGVKSTAIKDSFYCNAQKLEKIPFPQGKIIGSKSADYFLVKAGGNNDYSLINRFYNSGISFRIYTGSPAWSLNGEDVPAGSYVIFANRKAQKALPGLLKGLSTNLIALNNLDEAVETSLTKAIRPRVALYKPWTASMDEGWTRLVLDNFEFNYTNIDNAQIRAGSLMERFDCIILPSVSTKSLLEGRAPDTTFPEYVGGIGTEGVTKLQEFVEDGGTLVCIDASSNLPIEYFNIPVRNVLKDNKDSEFFCPGSILRLSIDTKHPLGYGMPGWYSGFFSKSQAFDLIKASSQSKEQGKVEKASDRHPAKRFPAQVVSRFSDTLVLESGWIRGEDLIADKSAIVEVSYGKGRIDLLGIRVQHRGQPHGTFRILFNAIQRSTL